MAETVRGINVVIGADTTKLSKALSDVNQKSKDIQSELRQVDRLLKFDPGNTELLAQKQQLLSQAVANTTEKLNRLKSVQQQVNEQFQRGEISEGQYRAFQREIVKTEQELQRLQERLQETEQEQQKIASSTKQLQTLFEATGTSVDQFADALGIKLTNAIKNGTASSKQLDEAISKIGQAALGANVDLDKLKAALASVDDGNSIANVKKELSNLAKEANEAKESVGDLGVELESVAGALVAGGGIAGAIEKSLDVSTLKTKIDVTFEVPESSVGAVKEAIKTIESYGVDAEAALEGVRRQWALNKNASDEVNTAIVKGAAAIASSYSGIDFTELIQEVNEISRELNITNEEALGLTNALLKIGFPPEQLDIIAEYGQQLQRAGYTAQEIQALFAAGIETGTWNIDNLLDGLKEGRIRVAEFGQEVPKAVKDLLAGTGISAKQMQEWGKAVAAGGEQGSQAMREIAVALNNIDNETKKNALGVAIFGTMYEDQGQNIIDTLLNAKNATVDFRANQEQLNDLVSKMDASPAVKLQQAFADLKTASEPLLGVIADVVSSIAEWVSNNPTLAATIAAIASTIGILVGSAMALAPIFTAIATAAGALGVSIGAIAAPIGIAIAAIAGLVAAGVAIYKNWDSIKAFLSKTWEAIKAVAVAVWDGIKAYFTTVLNVYKTIFTTVWNVIKTVVTTVWNALKATAQTVWNAITAFFTNILNKLQSAFSTIWNTIKTTVVNVWNGLKSTATSIFNALSSFFTSTWNSIKNTVITVWNNIKSTLTGIWNGLKSTASSVWNGIKSAISSVVNGISSTVSSVFNSIKSTATSIWNGIKSAITSPIESAKNTVLRIIDTIKNAFAKLSIKIPKPKIPDIDVDWKKIGVGDLSVKIPTFSVNWHKVGGVFTKPVIFGNAGFGDVEEAIVPFEGSHARKIAGLIAREMPNHSPTFNITLNYSGNGNEQDAYNMIDILERELGNRINTRLRMSGVRL
jgi:phage-related minor tail protein